MADAKLKAAAVFAGGGMKGAALAGALVCARSQKLDLVALGGSSAGAIVALLGVLGLDDKSIQDELSGISLDALLPNAEEVARFRSVRVDLAEFQEHAFQKRHPFESIGRLRRLHELVLKLNVEGGLFEQSALQQKLCGFIKKALPGTDDPAKLTFAELEAKTGRKLRVLVSNIASRTAEVFPKPGRMDDPVVPFVAASAAFPFLFKPLRILDAIYVDGGLASNLPVFMFQDLLDGQHIPTLAFDLKQHPSEGIIAGMVDTALDAHDEVMRGRLPGIYYCAIPVPGGVGTLDFEIDQDQKGSLFQAGQARAGEFFSSFLPLTRLGSSEAELQQHLRVLYGERQVIETALSGVAYQAQSITPARNVRASVMLPTGRGTRMVVYSYGFSPQAGDLTLELGFHEGASGAAHQYKAAIFYDRSDHGPFHPLALKNGDQRVSAAVATILSLPIYSESGDVLATLNLDTTTPAAQTGWDPRKPAEAGSPSVANASIFSDWTKVLAGLFKPWRQDV